MDYENANKALDKARAKNRDVLQAETSQQLCCHKFEKISESAKQGQHATLQVIESVFNSIRSSVSLSDHRRTHESSYRQLLEGFLCDG